MINDEPDGFFEWLKKTFTYTECPECLEWKEKCSCGKEDPKPLKPKMKKVESYVCEECGEHYCAESEFCETCKQCLDCCTCTEEVKSLSPQLNKIEEKLDRIIKHLEL